MKKKACTKKFLKKYLRQPSIDFDFVIYRHPVTLFTRDADHRGLLRFFFFFSSTLKTTREESKMSNFHTTLFQNSFVLAS